MINPMHPGQVLKESYLEPLKLTVTEAATQLGITRKTLSELINQKSDISVKMAYKLAKACDTTPKFWLNMQLNYNIWHSRNFDVSGVKPFNKKSEQYGK